MYYFTCISFARAASLLLNRLTLIAVYVAEIHQKDYLQRVARHEDH